MPSRTEQLSVFPAFFRVEGQIAAVFGKGDEAFAHVRQLLNTQARIVGPAFRDIASRHASRPDALVYLKDKIRSGGSGTWGAIPMPPQSLPEADARVIAQWLVDSAGDGARK